MKYFIYLITVAFALPILAKDETLAVKVESPAKPAADAPVVTITVDEAFTTKHENTPPSIPFQVTAPKGKNLRILAGGKKTGVPELLRLTLPATDEKQAAEILRFGALKLLAGPKEVRLQSAATLLKTKAFPMFTKGFENPKALETYVTKVGEYDAICLHIEMSAPGGKPAYLVKAMAILNPSGADGVTAFLMADNQLSDVKTSDDLTSKGIGLQILHTVKFLPKP